jgi:hypothetical protein
MVKVFTYNMRAKAMKRVFPYYDVLATIRYGDKPWPEFPHVYFANINPTEDMGVFRKRYGLLLNSPFQPSDVAIVKAQEMLRKAWKRDERALKVVLEGFSGSWEPPSKPPSRLPEIGEGVTFLPGPGCARLEDPPKFETKINAQGMTLHASDIWSFLRLAFMRDYVDGKTKICANLNCQTPFFLQGKKGQMFCSHSCASVAGVLRWRAKQAKATSRKGRKGQIQ